MASFFKTFFASLLGFIVGSLLLVFIGVAIIVGIAVGFSEPKAVMVHANSILKIDLNGPIEERAIQHGANFSLLGGVESDKSLGLLELKKILKVSKSDKDIKAIYLNVQMPQAGWATLQSLRAALLDFKTSGKTIYAYGEVMSQKGYYIASVADKVYLTPQGYIEFAGLSVNITFLKGALDKLGIEPQIFYCGKFKSATEPLRATKMSEPNKIQTTAFMQTIYNSFMGEIASSRKIPFQRLDSISQNLLVRSASSAMQFHLVDKTLYYDQFLAELTEKTGLKGDELKSHFLSVKDYANSKQINFDADNTDATNRIAVVFMNGDIVDGKGEKDNIGSEKFAEQLRKIRLDDSYKALVLRVNSPGGSALASDVMWREITLLKKKMPVIVSMGDYAASGGYYISCPADTIFAMPTTLTGSIGVFGILPCMEKFLNDKLGITNDGVKTGKYSDMPNLTRALTADEKAIVQAGVDSIYIDFLSKVSAGRKQSRAVIDSIAQGRVWAGPAGINVHLVDRLGDLEQAIDCARKMAKLDKCQKVYLPKNEPKWTEMLVEAISESEETKIKTSLGDLYPVFKQVLWVKELKGVQARLPYVMELR